MTPRELDKLIAKAEDKKWYELDLNADYIEGDDERNNLCLDPLTCLPESIGRLTNLQELYLANNQLTSLPQSIEQLTNLQGLYLAGNQLTSLPGSVERLTNLTSLNLYGNQLTSLPEWICQLTKLQRLDLRRNQLISLPESIGQLINLSSLNLDCNELTSLPESIGQLINIQSIDLGSNRLTNLPESIEQLISLTRIGLNNNPLNDLTILQFLPKLEQVYFLDVKLPRRYWTELSEWQPQWLLDEYNAEIRKLLIQQIGYERICQELNASAIDYWREYSLIKIESIDIEPMVLLKMICPSTGHIHILRVPPDMTSAEDAITWVNHGIHPDKFAIQT